MDSSKITDAVSSYFNNVLRNSLKYPETYTVNFDEDTSRLTLIPSIENSGLIKKNTI